MTLANMRQHVRSREVWAECVACRHKVRLNVDRLPDDVPVPDSPMASMLGLRRQARQHAAGAPESVSDATDGKRLLSLRRQAAPGRSRAASPKDNARVRRAEVEKKRCTRESPRRR